MAPDPPVGAPDGTAPAVPVGLGRAENDGTVIPAAVRQLVIFFSCVASIPPPGPPAAPLGWPEGAVDAAGAAAVVELLEPPHAVSTRVEAIRAMEPAAVRLCRARSMRVLCQ
jgi:hypothetical protein